MIADINQKLKDAQFIKLNGIYLIYIGNKLALELMKLGFEVRGYNKVDFCFDDEYYDSDGKTPYDRAVEYSETGKLYLSYLCIHTPEIGDEFIPRDNSYCINLATGESSHLVQWDEYDEDFLGPDRKEQGATFIVTKDPYFELNPYWKWGTPTKHNELLMFVHIKSNRTNNEYKCLVSQYV